AFYMEPDPTDPRLSMSCDCLAPEGYGEIIGGGQRMSSLELLTRRIDEHGLPQSAFEWYKDLRRYGTVPHSGFGIGVERTLAWLAGLEHVRESAAFARMLYRLTPGAAGRGAAAPARKPGRRARNARFFATRAPVPTVPPPFFHHDGVRPCPTVH